MTLGEKLRYLREVEGTLRGLGRAMTQSEVARTIAEELGSGLTQAYLSQVENSRRKHLTDTSRMLLSRFFKVHPGYLVNDPEGFHTELQSAVRTAEDSLDLWLIHGAERFASDAELSNALLKLARHEDTRTLHAAGRGDPRRTRPCRSPFGGAWAGEQAKAGTMTWSDFYLFCFAVGFFFSLVQMLLGHIPGGHDWHLHAPHGGGHHGLHGGTITRPSKRVDPTLTAREPRSRPSTPGRLPHSLHGSEARVISPQGCMRCGWLPPSYCQEQQALQEQAWFSGSSSRVLMREREELDPADYEMVGVLGTVSCNIRARGSGRDSVFAGWVAACRCGAERGRSRDRTRHRSRRDPLRKRNCVCSALGRISRRNRRD